ncbi:MAG: hypothetical protein ACLR56_15415 [Oscillospiraceae bacterium]
MLRLIFSATRRAVSDLALRILGKAKAWLELNENLLRTEMIWNSVITEICAPITVSVSAVTLRTSTAYPRTRRGRDPNRRAVSR